MHIYHPLAIASTREKYIGGSKIIRLYLQISTISLAWRLQLWAHILWIRSRTPLGRRIVTVANNKHPTLIADPTTTTRTDPGKEKDTSPDVAWIRGLNKYSPSSMQGTVGTDHC